MNSQQGSQSSDSSEDTAGFAMEELTARVIRAELRLDDLERGDDLSDDLGHDLGDDYDGYGTLAGQSTGRGQQRGYADLDSWVEQFFAVTFTRSIGGEYRWCVRWREHPEAVFRLDALWRSFETLRKEGGMGTAVWLRDHLDQQHSILLSGRGPFALCTATRHEILHPLPVGDGVLERPT